MKREHEAEDAIRLPNIGLIRLQQTTQHNERISLVVTGPNTVVEPQAVVVKHIYTLPAFSAVAACATAATRQQNANQDSESQKPHAHTGRGKSEMGMKTGHEGSQISMQPYAEERGLRQSGA